jgi:hypothetical protein
VVVIADVKAGELGVVADVKAGEVVIIADVIAGESRLTRTVTKINN